MKKNIAFEPYQGNEPFCFFRFDEKDRAAASVIINYLIERQFRICYDERDKTVKDSEWLSNSILSSTLVAFCVSAGSLESLEFRNSVNFALSKKKQVFIIYLDDSEPGYGFDIQLANVPNVHADSYHSMEELCEDIEKTGCFSQDMRGEDAKIPVKNSRKKAAVIAIASVLAVFILAAVAITIYRINYDNSIAGQIEKMETADYIDLSGEDAALIELLRGKTIRTLVAREMGLTDIEALAFVQCEELDLSGNPDVATLEPLLNNASIKTVSVTQDMVPAISHIKGQNQFTVVITG